MDGSILQLEDIYSIHKFPLFIQAVKNIGEFDENSMILKTSIPMNYGFPFKRACKLLKLKTMDRFDRDKENDAMQWLTFFESKYHKLIAKPAKTMARINKRNKREELPTAKDVEMISKYIKLKSEEASQILENKFCPKAYRSLAETTLTHLVVFNRKRPGEMERLKIGDFNNRKNIDQNSDYYESMDFVDKFISNEHVLIGVEGKKYQNINLLATKNHCKYINLLMSHRRQAGIHPKNQFVFGVGTLSTLSAYDSLN